MGVEQLAGQRRRQRQVEAADRPGGDHAEAREHERGPDRARHLGALRPQPRALGAQPPARAAPACPASAIANSTNTQQEGRDARVGRLLDEHGRDGRAQPDAERRADAVDEPGLHGVAARMQVEHRRARPRRAPRRSRAPAAPRAANSQITDLAAMYRTVASSSATSAPISTGRRPISSDRRPISSSEVSTPSA